MNAHERRLRLSSLMTDLRDAINDGLFLKDTWTCVTVDDGTRLRYPQHIANDLVRTIRLMMPEADLEDIKEWAAQYQGIDLHEAIDETN